MKEKFALWRRAVRSCVSTSWGAVLVPAVLLISASAGAATTTVDQRGFVTEGMAGRLVFQRCEANKLAPQLLALNDKTTALALRAGLEVVWQQRRDVDRPIYVEFRGETTGSLVTARQFQRAIGHVETCIAAPAAPAQGVRVLAEGRLPAWRLLATSSGTRLEIKGAKPLLFPAALLTAADDKQVRNLAAKATQGGDTLRLSLTEKTCSDEGSETAYGAQAVVQLGGRRFEGCAARF